jgi:hypothetical protein
MGAPGPAGRPAQQGSSGAAPHATMESVQIVWQTLTPPPPLVPSAP